MSDYFPRDLLMPILEWLPSKSLFRFRCVSKEFRSLFSDGFHLIYHRSRNSHHFTHYSLHHPETYDQYFHFELPLKIGKLLYVNSCLGFCCLFGHPNIVVIWNPLIWKFQTLPKPSLLNSISASGLHFYAHGLGVDQPNGDYKVVRLVYLMIEDDMSAMVTLFSEVEVLSLKTLCWKRVSGPTICVSQTLSPAYVNGVVHWICLGTLMWVTRYFARWHYPMGWHCEPLRLVRARFWLVIMSMDVVFVVSRWW